MTRHNFLHAVFRGNNYQKENTWRRLLREPSVDNAYSNLKNKWKAFEKKKLNGDYHSQTVKWRWFNKNFTEFMILLIKFYYSLKQSFYQFSIQFYQRKNDIRKNFNIYIMSNLSVSLFRSPSLDTSEILRSKRSASLISFVTRSVEEFQNRVVQTWKSCAPANRFTKDVNSIEDGSNDFIIQKSISNLNRNDGNGQLIAANNHSVV